MQKRSSEELSKLLAHADMRVRQEAQFELARRVIEGRGPCMGTARPRAIRSGVRERNHAGPDPRASGAWASSPGASGKSDSPSSGRPSSRLLADHDAEVRAQAARVLGESREVGAPCR